MVGPARASLPAQAVWVWPRFPTRRSDRVILHLPVGLLLILAILGPAQQRVQADAHPVETSIAAATMAVAAALDPARAAAEGSLTSGVASAAELPEASEPAPPPVARVAGGPGPLIPLTYTVQPGESLATIADKFGIDVPTLLGSNSLDDPDFIPAGRQLKVPPVRGVLYSVGEGDTLNRIAERYGLEVRDILRVNDLESSELIRPGQDLVLPDARPLPARAATRVDVAAAAAEPLLPAWRPPFVWPAGGPITTYFGEVDWTSPRGHAGVDIAAPWGAPVTAAQAGQVLVATRAGGAYGIEVIVDHGNGLRTLYGHLSQLNVDPGERVDRGQLIGLVGNTGFSTGAHLHFEVRQNGELKNPLGYLP